MALDPSISLRGTPPVAFDPMGAAQKGLSLRELATRVQYQPQMLEAELAASRASTAATEQQTAEQARQLAGSRRIAEIVKANTRIDPKTGKVIKDSRAIADLAAAEGLPTEVVFKYTADAVKHDADKFKVDSDKDIYLRNQGFLAANLMRNAKTPDEAIRIAQGFKAGDAKVVGDERAEQFYTTLFGQFDANMDPREAAKTLSTSLAISELQERNLIPGGLSTDQLDPGSKLNARDRALLKSVGIDVPATMTREQLQNLEPFKKLIEGVIPSEGTRVGGLQSAAEAAAARAPLQAALALKGSLKQFLKTRPGGKVGELINTWITQDPNHAVVQSELDAYNARNKTNFSFEKDGVDAVFAILEKEDRRLRSMQESGAEVAGTGNLRQSGGRFVTPEQQAGRDEERVRILEEELARTTNPADRAALERELRRAGKKVQSAPAEPAKKMVRIVRIKDGKVASVPEDVAERMLQNPRLYKRAGGK